MKDIVVNGHATIAKDAVYKDVVVVGNGPSGIALSFMLAGHWPYWSPDKVRAHPDELLRARLTFAGSDKSLVQQDLETLAEGLEGRSTNPVSLLLDSLQNPCADIGMTLPTMLEYRHHADKQIDHVVLGKGPPGGSWHRMDPNLRTLSLSTWMSLPGFDFSTWESTHPSTVRHPPLPPQPTPIPEHRPMNGHDSIVHHSTESNRTQTHLTRDPTDTKHCRLCMDHDCSGKDRTTHRPPHQHNKHRQRTASLTLIDASSDAKNDHVGQIDTNNNNNNRNSTETNAFRLPRRNLAIQRQVSKEVQTRALVSRVAEYYESYVREMNLSRYFVDDTVVTSVQPIKCEGAMRHQRVRWIVRGHNSSGKSFTYICRNVVLAVGASDLPNRLGLRGESLGHPWIKHELPQLELALESMTQRERTKLKPVLIIGAGLSAADAVTICRSSQVPVIHVYRNSSVGLDKMLPEAVYPEYHAVHKMMKDSSVPYDLYTPLAEHTLVDVSPSASNDPNATHQVTLLNQKTGTTRRFEVSFCAVLIGSRPDLRLITNINQPSTLSAKPYPPIQPNLQPHQLVQTPHKDGTGFFEQLTAMRLFEMPHTANNHRTNDEHWLLGRKLSWLKNLCLTCRAVNVCEWSRRNDHRKLCGHHTGKPCECPKLLTVPAASTETMTMIDEDRVVALQLGEDPLKPIDCKTNPMAVNKYTNEVQRTGRGLYAMGPLVGDNFVRFISGGALAITSALHQEND